jgi:hypothetical protein
MVSERYREDEVRCTFRLPDPAHSVFDFDLYVLPNHRAGIGFLAVWQGFNIYQRQRGVDMSYSRMTRFNLPSRRAHARLGARCVGRLLVLRIGLLELTLATMHPFVAMTWRADKRIEIRLPAPSSHLDRAIE